ncbi:adenine phosphoribosyltransferase [Mycoblastus sanguinarius]|nr:adenine phosphoribosyltransferase [Mycoblastus sanguinarius]
MPDSTSSHPPGDRPDATETPGLPARIPSSSAELASLKIRLHKSLRQFPDFPQPGILFEDILPLFSDLTLHEALIRALDLHIRDHFSQGHRPDVLVGLEARAFLFGPSLALRFGSGFVPVRKHGKLPGPTETVSYEKEYGEDLFQIQADAIKPGQQVLVVDDIIATGGSAAAAGTLVRKLGGILLGYVFILELDFLKGRDKLDAPVYTLLSSQEDSPSKS